MTKISDILIRAKGLLNAHPRAWIKWQMYGQQTPEGPTFCAMGACQQASYELGGGYPIASEILNKAAVEVAEELGKPLITPYNGSYTYNKIAAWSNMIAKTAPSVACVMRATAQWLEERDGNE